MLAMLIESYAAIYNAKWPRFVESWPVDYLLFHFSHLISIDFSRKFIVIDTNIDGIFVFHWNECQRNMIGCYRSNGNAWHILYSDSKLCQLIKECLTKKKKNDELSFVLCELNFTRRTKCRSQAGAAVQVSDCYRCYCIHRRVCQHRDDGKLMSYTCTEFHLFIWREALTASPPSPHCESLWIAFHFSFGSTEFYTISAIIYAE